DERRAPGRGLPKLAAQEAVVGDEEHPALELGHQRGLRGAERTRRAGVDVSHQPRAFGRPERIPQLGADEAVVGAEENRAAEFREIERIGTKRTGANVSDQYGALRYAESAPQFRAVQAVVGAEEQLPVEYGNAAGAGQIGQRQFTRVGTCRPRIDVANHEGFRNAAVAVATPQLAAMDAVVRGKEQESPERDQLGRIRARRPQVNVANDLRPYLSAVAHPQFPAVQSVVGGEEELIADDRQIQRI